MKNFRKGILLFCSFFSLVTYGQTVEPLLRSESAFRKDTAFSVKDGANETRLPVTVIKGKNKGPVFSIVAGVHGYEYPPIVAVQELLNEVDINMLSGTLIVVPIANIEAFYGRTPFINPVDGKNLNNTFPGSATGTVTEQLAYLITREIIDHSDFFLDIHGGDASEDLLPFVCYYNRRDTPEETKLAKTLSEKSGFRHIVSYPYTITSAEPAKYAFKQATQQGITALSIEAGKLGNVQPENVRATKQAVYNMLAHLGIYKAPSAKTVPDTRAPVLLNAQTYIRVPEKGIFYSKHKSGDKVKKGDVLGFITDEFGNRKAEIRSPAEGTILYKVGTPPVNKGETLFCIGSVEE
ncbi:succinylglutamate desuccinylase/aspartoacylase family protein [Sinomicrobium kalidii]|uniref:succinylglutamate desuccinylase/aspartoacylase family protein n=1 Tax=Sinomicrobium kalidii TaxID=2900738 RepID=UPI001E56A972|nr:M14 family metallopeptidase [Sinomicrobium kalidii]UGU15488.1 succinylglutamate desuccinylase/aspartoacylase family protein [Sinomicrobium kalidii]